MIPIWKWRRVWRTLWVLCTGTFTGHRFLHEQWGNSQGYCSWYCGSSEVQIKGEVKETNDHAEKEHGMQSSDYDSTIRPECQSWHHCFLRQVTSVSLHEIICIQSLAHSKYPISIKCPLFSNVVGWVLLWKKVPQKRHFQVFPGEV